MRELKDLPLEERGAGVRRVLREGMDSLRRSSRSTTNNVFFDDEAGPGLFDINPTKDQLQPREEAPAAVQAPPVFVPNTVVAKKKRAVPTIRAFGTDVTNNNKSRIS